MNAAEMARENYDWVGARVIELRLVETEKTLMKADSTEDSIVSQAATASCNIHIHIRYWICVTIVTIILIGIMTALHLTFPYVHRT